MIDELTGAFADRFGVAPNRIFRSPGRVNLIGEHTDYSLLPVLPMAIDRAVYLAVGPGTDGRIVAESATEAEPFEAAVDGLGRPWEGWHRYLVAAIETIVPDRAGARLFIDSDLPATGGLSSSSAFSVGVLAALDHVWRRGHQREDFIELAAAAERRIGVESGAMDQTVIALAQRDHALRIDFDPITVRHVPIPDDIRVVAAYSGSPAPKGGSAREQYNLRVVACRAAALLLGDLLGIEMRTPPVLGDVAEAAGEAVLGRLPAMATAVEVANRLGVDPTVMTGLTKGSFDPMAPLPVEVVARHVVSEAGRVDEAETALRTADLTELGRLLNASHRSLQEFGASSPALDRLTAAMREAGAAGARITGAGFGGYAVAMCRPDKVEDLVEAALGATGGPAFEVRPSDGVRAV